MIQYN